MESRTGVKREGQVLTLMGPGATVARAYDAHAAEYDVILERDPIAQYMRRRLHDHLARVFRPGDRVLDLTAGTGLDACFLAARGVHVLALDISPGMLEELRRNAVRDQLQIEARVLAAERLDALEERELDGAISTFAGLNTIEDPRTLARELALRLKPGGRVIVHALGNFCFWEWGRALLHGQRWRPRPRPSDVLIGTQIVAHHYYNPFSLWQGAFAPYFTLSQVYGLSVIAAPSLVRRFPRGASALFALDRLAGRLWPAAGDFYVADMEKRAM